MAKGNTPRPSTGKGSASYGRGVTPQRLSQPTGSKNAFGGYEKVSKPNGDFRMKKS